MSLPQVLMYVLNEDIFDLTKIKFQSVGGAEFELVNNYEDFTRYASLVKYDAIIIRFPDYNLTEQAAIEGQLSEFIASGKYRGQKGDPAIFVVDPIRTPGFESDFSGCNIIPAGVPNNQILEQALSAIANNKSRQ